MKTALLVFSILFFLNGFNVAQNSNTFKYQAAVRNSSGELVLNQTVSVRISIRDNTANGTILYRETHSVNSSAFGLINLNIGEGTPVSGSFETINWGISDKFLSVDIDLNGGNSFSFMGTSQLLSVPFSIHARESGGLVFMTSAERDAIVDPYMGMQLFNSDTRKINYYDGNGWLEINGVNQVAFNCGSPLLDSRDGNYYNTIDIGGDCWMAENLNYGIMINGSVDQSDNGIVEKFCYSNNENLCDVSYGALYQWREMMQYNTTEGAQGICPDGWHLPTMTEYNSLISIYGGSGSAGTALAEGGGSGFEALMAGQTNLFSYPFIDVGQRAYFWTSTQVNSNDAYEMYLIFNNSNTFINQQGKDFGHSVRCIKD
jgi:uncharacterized protein (TIGR02145 family)